MRQAYLKMLLCIHIGSAPKKGGIYRYKIQDTRNKMTMIFELRPILHSMRPETVSIKQTKSF